MSVREMMPPLRTLSALSDCSDADRDALLSEEKRRLIAAERRFKERRRAMLTRTSRSLRTARTGHAYVHQPPACCIEGAGQLAPGQPRGVPASGVPFNTASAAGGGARRRTRSGRRCTASPACSSRSSSASRRCSWSPPTSLWSASARRTEASAATYATQGSNQTDRQTEKRTA